MNWEVWGPPLVVLGVGSVLGAALAFRSIAQGRRARSAPGEAHAARKEVLLEALHEVDADREKLGDASWRAKREALVDEAASALRALDQGPAEAAPEAVVAASAPPTRPASSALGSVGWWAAGFGFFAALGYLLTTNSGDRAQGQPMTGGSSSRGGEDPGVAAAQAALEKNPNDLDALNALTWTAIRGRDLSGAMAYLDRARTISPEDPYVLTHLAVLQLQIGMNDRAEAALQKALEKNPTLPRALIFLGLARMQRDDIPGAIAALEQAVAASPANSEERQMAASLLSEAKAPPPVTHLTGAIALDAGAAPPATGTLYVFARASAEGAGPPVAALRLSPKGFPLAFSLTDKNIMMGGAWPDQVWIQARVDQDGNPTTRDDTLMETEVIGPLSTGAADITLVLKAASGAPAGAAPPASAGAASPGPAGAETTAPASGARVGGQVSVASGRAAPAGTLFIIARSSATGGGPPVAAQRVAGPAFPLSFSMSDGDMMLGGSWPAQVYLQARVDSDGNPTTKSDADLESAVVGPVSAGSQDVKLVLGGS